MVVGEAVLVRAVGRGAEGEGDLGQDLRLEDALHADERHAVALPVGAADAGAPMGGRRREVRFGARSSRRRFFGPGRPARWGTWARG